MFLQQQGGADGSEVLAKRVWCFLSFPFYFSFSEYLLKVILIEFYLISELVNDLRTEGTETLYKQD